MFAYLFKENPYRDALGQFTSKDKSVWFHGSTVGGSGIPDGIDVLRPGIDGALWLTRDPKKAARYATNTADQKGGEATIFVVADKDVPQDQSNWGDDMVRSTVATPKILGSVKVRKSGGFSYLFKANPYHDEYGRFTYAQNASRISRGGVFSRQRKSAEGVIREAELSIKQPTTEDYKAAMEKYMRDNFKKEKGYSEDEIRNLPAVFREDPGAYFDVWGDSLRDTLGFEVEHQGWRNASDRDFFKTLKAVKFADNELGDQKFAETVSEIMGAPKGVKIVARHDEMTFTLNGEAHSYGGYYNHTKKEIAVFPKTMGRETQVEVLRHEIQHSKFSAVISKKPLTFGVEELSRLEASDGVTPYSRDWWKAVDRGDAVHRQAIDETLAEISTLSTAAARKVAPEWRKLAAHVESEFQKLGGER